MNKELNKAYEEMDAEYARRRLEKSVSSIEIEKEGQNMLVEGRMPEIEKNLQT